MVVVTVLVMAEGGGAVLTVGVAGVVMRGLVEGGGGEGRRGWSRSGIVMMVTCAVAAMSQHLDCVGVVSTRHRI